MGQQKPQRNTSSKTRPQSVLMKELARILTNSAPFDVRVTEILKMIGSEFGVSRAYYFSLRTENKVWFAKQQLEWVAPNIEPQITNDELQDLEMTDVQEVIDVLLEQELFFGTVDNHPNIYLREILESQDIKSVLFAPVLLHNELAGLVGIDDCILPRVWSEYEKSTFQFTGSIISLILENHETRKEVNQLNQQLAISEESADKGIWVINLKENSMSFDESWQFMLGYSPEEVVPSPIWFEQLLHPEDKERVLQELDPFKDVKVTRVFSEYRIKAKNGNYRWVQTRAEIARDIHGWPITLRASNFDITARTTYRTSLQEAEEEYKKLVERLQDVIFKIDEERNFTFLNNAWLETTGFDVLLSLNKPLLDFVHPEDREKAQQILSETLKESGSNAELRLLHATGGYKWVQIMIKGLEDQSAEQSGTILDIHAQKQVQLALEESEERFRLMSENMTELVCMHDTRGILTYVSPSCEKFLGYKQQDMIGLDPGDLMTDAEREDVTKSLLHPMIDGNLSNDMVQVKIRKPDGTRIWIETVVRPIIKNGELESILSVSRDISARKAVEEEMEKALLKEKELNTLRSTFISMASHEFRTPLASIKSSIDLIDMYVEDTMPKAQSSFDRHLNKVRNQIDRLTDMMNDVLILGKTEAKKMPFESKPIDVITYCNFFIEQHFSNREDGRTIELKTHGNRRPVSLDAGLFGQILSNLITNAFKYSEGAPNPILTIQFLEEQVSLAFQDFGVGIPKEEQSQLFESFFRASNVIQMQGTGLGLVIVKEFVEMHNGTVNLQSEEGKGTCVEIRFNY